MDIGLRMFAKYFSGDEPTGLPNIRYAVMSKRFTIARMEKHLKSSSAMMLYPDPQRNSTCEPKIQILSPSPVQGRIFYCCHWLSWRYQDQVTTRLGQRSASPLLLTSSRFPGLSSWVQKTFDNWVEILNVHFSGL